MKTWTKQQVIVYIALLVLLAIRTPIAALISNFARLFGASTYPLWVESLRLIESWTYYLFERWSFVLVGIILIINRRVLKSLNIDEYFIAIFASSGVAFCFYYFWPLGWAAPLISIYLFILFKKREYEFVNTGLSFQRIITIIAIGFFLVLFILGLSDITKLRWEVHQSITDMPFVLVEEVIFRGLLWMFLKNLNWSEPKIVGLQAILFWLAHAYFMFTDPIFFWIITPIVSILLGIIVWRFRSLTISTVAHTLLNLLW